ncbi:MAG: methionyl-tRNA formyltransferase [Bacteroidales bacterium]|nr:methionyl-tRNA formyltransferase [Bacteroidales bacterium]
MRIVFMGTPDFATGILSAIVEEGVHEVCAVVTATDKQAGRGMHVQYSSVKQYALSKNLPILQPEKLKDADFVAKLKCLHADMFVVVAFRMLPEVVWSIPPKGTCNLHASLLPQYRGAAPINWAIINGETITGVTTFIINSEIDKGKIIFKQEVEISPQDTAGTLHDKLLEEGKMLMLKTLCEIEKGTAVLHVQPETNEKLAPKIYKEDCLINFSWTAKQVYDFVRGMSPYPAAHLFYLDDKNEPKMMKIFECTYQEEKVNIAPGIMQSDDKNILSVSCTNGYVFIKNLQLVGKRRMNIMDFLRGNKGFNGKKCLNANCL